MNQPELFKVIKEERLDLLTGMKKMMVLCVEIKEMIESGEFEDMETEALEKLKLIRGVNEKNKLNLGWDIWDFVDAVYDYFDDRVSDKFGSDAVCDNLDKELEDLIDGINRKIENIIKEGKGVK